MAIHDFTSQRLYVELPLGADTTVSLTREQANYLLNVLRMKSGDELMIFNGRDGEWRCAVQANGKRDCTLKVLVQTRSQESGPDVHLLFAPLKRARLDYMVQKATELGVRSLQPVTTERTIVDRVNEQRMQANVVEAAEQCGILYLPEVRSPEKLKTVLKTWNRAVPLVFCDEAAENADPILALASLGTGPVSVLIGPEGGFSDDERQSLLTLESVRPISLGPRIMRADTAAVAALSLINATIGDWKT
jgi:16S rRNA (uracil1498-N3)-methyltransferase